MSVDMTDFDAWLAHHKSVWTRVYDEVIAPDLEKEWKKRTNAHEIDLRNREEELRILRDHISNDVVQRARLTDENSRLKFLLQKHGIALSADELDHSADEASIPAKAYKEVIEQLDHLNKSNEGTARRIQYLERKNIAVMQKNKDMKDSVKAWQEYAERHLEKKKVKAEEKAERIVGNDRMIETSMPVPNLPSSPASAPMRTPRFVASHERSSPDPTPELRDGTIRAHTVDAMSISDEGHTNPQTNAADCVPTERQPSSHLAPGNDHPKPNSSSRTGRRSDSTENILSEQVASSQTTVPEMVQDHETMLLAAQSVGEDDTPRFMYERSLKRKRNAHSGHHILSEGSSDGTPAKPVRIKEELRSSPPVGLTVDTNIRKDTIDLDELGPKSIVTPRRRKSRRAHSGLSSGSEILRDQRSSSAPSGGDLVKIESTKEGNIMDCIPHPCPIAEAEDARAESEPTSTNLKGRKILQPLHPNVVANRAMQDAPSKRIKKEQIRNETESNIIGESGEMPPPVDGRKKKLPPSVARAHFNDRVRAAKSGLTPTKTALKTPNSAPAKKSITPGLALSPSDISQNTPSVRSLQRSAPAKVPRPEIIPDDRPIWRMGAIGSLRKTPALPPPSEQAQGRLRDRPVAELRIQDFKANPAYNGGYTHAFTDTVRRREDRLCLPGCTNPSCCGSTFRTLALAAPRLSSSQEEALLQDYLGDAYDNFGLTQMEKTERDEIILQARTRQLATEHGKHRQAYEGRKTPPGFWRVDFPNTQEQEEDREKAAQMEQSEIRNRWLEAMRRGGKYIFADE